MSVGDLIMEKNEDNMGNGLGRITVSRKTGEERFHDGATQTDFDMLDFWQWSASDLIGNTARGVLAEYLVAKSLGISTAGVREGWLAWDLTTDDGVRIQVKSAAFIQSWHQDKLSEIEFKVSPKKGWNPDSNRVETVPKHHADLYVFALLTHTDKATVDPYDLRQWKFYVLPTQKLCERTRSPQSVTLRSLETLAGPPTDFWHLSDSVKEARGLVSP